MTALTTFLTNTASATLATANQLYSISGNPATVNVYNRVGTATGYGECTAQGTTSAWAAGGSLPAPTGKGFLFDVTTLEGNQFAAANWNGTVRLNCAQNGNAAPNAGTLTADIIMRAYKRSSGGTYTNIAVITLAGQTIPSGFTSFSLPTTAGSAMTFSTGDKLYCDVFLNVTANTNANATQDVRFNRLSTDTGGSTGDNNASLVSPGYTSSIPGSGMTITIDGKNLLRDGNSGAQTPIISYVALGTSSATPTVNDHTLGAEAFRKKVTSTTNGANGELLINLYFAPTDGVGLDVEEVGFFGGNATAAANSGVLFAHGLYVHNPKVNTESIQFLLDLIYN